MAKTRLARSIFLLVCIYKELLARWIDNNPSAFIPSIIPSIVLLTYQLISLLALFLAFWLGSATEHRSHTPTDLHLRFSTSSLPPFLPFPPPPSIPSFSTLKSSNRKQPQKFHRKKGKEFNFFLIKNFSHPVASLFLFGCFHFSPHLRALVCSYH